MFEILFPSVIVIIVIILLYTKHVIFDHDSNKKIQKRIDHLEFVLTHCLQGEKEIQKFNDLLPPFLKEPKELKVCWRCAADVKTASEPDISNTSDKIQVTGKEKNKEDINV